MKHTYEEDTQIKCKLRSMKKHIFTAMEFNAARPTKQVRKFRSERISKQLVKVSTRIIKKKFPVQQYIYIVVQHLNA